MSPKPHTGATFPLSWCFKSWAKGGVFIPEDYEPEAESCLRTDLGSGILCVLLRFCGMVILHKMEAAKWMGFSPGSFPSISKVDDFEALLLLPNPSSLPQGFFCSLLCPAGLLQGKSKTKQNQGKVGISFNDRLLLHRQKPSPSWGELRYDSFIFSFGDKWDPESCGFKRRGWQ